MPQMAAFIAELPVQSNATITITGRIMYQPSLMSCLATGRCSFGRPRRPRLSASKGTFVKMPVKYSSAGIQAASAIVPYEQPMYSVMMNAAAPITGGMICPPVDAVASTAPAK